MTAIERAVYADIDTAPGFSPAGKPIGLQLIGRAQADLAVLQIATELLAEAGEAALRHYDPGHLRGMGRPESRACLSALRAVILV